jgi:hypothetical protein
LSLGYTSLIRVGIGNPDVGGDDLHSCGVPRISLRREAGKLRATEGGANAYPSVCVSSFRHAHNMTETTWKNPGPVQPKRFRSGA